MLSSMFSLINYWAVFLAAIVFWVLGYLWFSHFFRKPWAHEIERLGIKIVKPKKEVMISKSIMTFIWNFIIAWGVALFVYALGIPTMASALGLGLVIGICFCVAVMWIGYIWENRSLKLTLIDVGYPFVGIILSSLILTYMR